MTYSRRIWALSALALTLVLAACSTSDDLQQTGLEPQFGSAETDNGVDVAFVSTGRIYSLATESGPTYDDYGDGDIYESGFYKKVLLRRYDASGTLTWTKTVDQYSCNNNYDICGDLEARSVSADSQGNIYTTSFYDGTYDDCIGAQSNYVRKYSASGGLVKDIFLGSTGASFGESYNGNVAVAVDGSGNIYAALEKVGDLDNVCDYGETPVNVVAKYSTNGALQWQRTSTVGILYGITVSSSGSVYVTGSKGLARYTSTGNLTWTKAVGLADQVIVSGSNVYTRYQNTIKKFDGNGKLLLTKAQTGLSGINIQDMTGDTSGNLYISGKYNVSSSDRNAFTRKLNSSGSVLWTKTFGTPAFDDAKGIATINGSEIYVTGLTKGSLAHTNIGGDDGYIRKLNSSGNPVWTK